MFKKMAVIYCCRMCGKRIPVALDVAGKTDIDIAAYIQELPKQAWHHCNDHQEGVTDLIGTIYSRTLTTEDESGARND